MGNKRNDGIKKRGNETMSQGSGEMFEALGVGEYFECNSETGDKRVHKVLKTYKGYINVYYCPECGKRFNIGLHHSEKKL